MQMIKTIFFSCFALALVHCDGQRCNLELDQTANIDNQSTQSISIEVAIDPEYDTGNTYTIELEAQEAKESHLLFHETVAIDKMATEQHIDCSPQVQKNSLYLTQGSFAQVKNCMNKKASKNIFVALGASCPADTEEQTEPAMPL